MKTTRKIRELNECQGKYSNLCAEWFYCNPLVSFMSILHLQVKTSKDYNSRRAKFVPGVQELLEENTAEMFWNSPKEKTQAECSRIEFTSLTWPQNTRKPNLKVEGNLIDDGTRTISHALHLKELHPTGVWVVLRNMDNHIQSSAAKHIFSV
jgi:hypothetical protein